jgi:hypothetical protein
MVSPVSMNVSVLNGIHDLDTEQRHVAAHA